MIKNVLKEKKFWIWLVVIYALVLILLGSLIIPSANRHNDAIKKNIQKAFTAAAKEYGVENVEVVYVDEEDGKVVISCDHMSELFYEQKEQLFLAMKERMETKGQKYAFYEIDETVIYSDGNRYKTNDSVSSIYENGSAIDPGTNMITVRTKGFGQ